MTFRNEIVVYRQAALKAQSHNKLEFGVMKVN